MTYSQVSTMRSCFSIPLNRKSMISGRARTSADLLLSQKQSPRRMTGLVKFQVPTRKSTSVQEPGLTLLDSITSGLNKSDLIIIAARPGMGKTSFAMNNRSKRRAAF